MCKTRNTNKLLIWLLFLLLTYCPFWSKHKIEQIFFVLLFLITMIQHFLADWFPLLVGIMENEPDGNPWRIRSRFPLLYYSKMAREPSKEIRRVLWEKEQYGIEEGLRTEHKLKCYKRLRVLYFLDVMSVILLFEGASLVIYEFEPESKSLYGKLLTLLKKRQSETGANNPHCSNIWSWELSVTNFFWTN